MWDEIMDMPGEIFDIDDRDLMPLDMQDDIEKEDPLLDMWQSDKCPLGVAKRPHPCHT